MPGPRSLRPFVTALVPALLLSLTACGDDAPSPVEIQGAKGFDAVEISGEPGSEPKVTWKDQLEADELEVKTLVEGDGAELKAGDKVLTHLWVGNGFDRTEKYSTYDEGGAQEVTVDEENLGPIFLAALEGQTKGSRVAVVGSAEEAFGEAGNPGLGIGNGDTVLLIADLAAEPLAAPQGEEQEAPAWVPQLVTQKGEPTAFRFKGSPRPTGELRKAVLIEGEGPAVKKGQSITVNYLGQVYGKRSPFDENFSKEVTSFGIGTGGVIEGWDQGLVGVPVGSRVVLAIPPDLGYGKKGNEPAGISGTDTLYFVIDVLGAV